jgi:hypothetical protein
MQKFLESGQDALTFVQLEVRNLIISEVKGKPFPALCDRDRMCDFAFCIKITRHINELNINLQEASHLMNEMFDKITAFERKLRLLKLLTAIKLYDALSISEQGKGH